MATLLIATPVDVHSGSLRNSALIADVRGLHGQKTSLKKSQQSSVSASYSVEGQRPGGSNNAGSQGVVSKLESSMNSLLSIPPADWIAAFSLKEVHVNPHRAVVASTFQKLEVSEYEAAGPYEIEIGRSEKVIFTEEKARRLRKANRDTQTFHDKWYHSAIASRLSVPE